MFSQEDIEDVLIAERGGFVANATRLTVNEEGNIVKAHVFDRPTLNTPLERKPRCPYLDEDARQCTYTVERCPGHPKQ